jgi:signal transduction histidine kinase
MDDTSMRADLRVPPSYWLAAGLGSAAILISYATASWVPWFAPQMYDYGAGLAMRGPGLLLAGSTVLGFAFLGVPWIAVRWPAVAIGLALLPVAVTLLDPSSLGVHFGVFVCLCSVVLTAGWRSPRGSIAAAAAAAAFVIGWLFSGAGMAAPFRSAISLDETSGGKRVVIGLLYLIALGLVGLVAWRMRVGALRELEHRRLSERAGAVEEQAAVVAERSRLARDLHDVVAHHVSLIAVRAETAPYTHPNLDQDSRTVLTDIAADARLALDELRGVLGILGRAGEDANRAPQPAWPDIAALVERTRSTGTVVMLQGDPPETASVSPSVGYAAYRVVQEALTNARKHAGGRPVRVNLVSTGQLVVARISTPLRGDEVAMGSGHGLAGMRERVEALGGRLQAGPVGDDFVVEATLPQASA